MRIALSPHRLADGEDIGQHRAVVAGDRRSYVDDHVDLGCALIDGQSRFSTLDQRMMLPRRESDDGRRHKSLGANRQHRRRDTDSQHTEAACFVDQGGHIGRGGFGFEESVVHHRGNLGTSECSFRHVGKLGTPPRDRRCSRT